MTNPYRGVLEVIRRYGMRRSAVLAWREARYLLVDRLLRGSYSQHGEDRLAWELLGRRPDGCYVDLGCHDAVRLSNTYLLYRKGWRGLAVDAAEDHRARFEQLRPGDRFVASGIGATPGTQPFYVHTATAVSTFSAEQSARYARAGHPCVEIVEVPVRTVADLLDEFVGDRPIDFLTVDLEGVDLEALRSNDWGRFRPELVCVEISASAAGAGSDLPADDAAAIDALLTGHGYAAVARRGVNAFYRRREASSANNCS